MKRFNQKDPSHPLRGAAYIRYSSEMQNDSFSLDAQLRQIKEQAERDNVEIVRVYSGSATSAYRKKYRPGINAMREGARRGEFDVLYIHKVDRLERPSLVIHLRKTDVFCRMFTGRINLPIDLLTGQLKLGGNLRLFPRLGTLFSVEARQ